MSSDSESNYENLSSSSSDQPTQLSKKRRLDQDFPIPIILIQPPTPIITPQTTKKPTYDKKTKEVLKEIRMQVDVINKKKYMTDVVDQILLSNFDIQTKAKIISNFENLGDDRTSEKTKMTNWVNQVLKIPVGIFKPLTKHPFDINNFLLSSRKKLDDAVYGMESVKEEIIDFLLTIVTKRDSKLPILALQGPKGVGKCFAKDTEILMYSGDTKKVQNVVIGDKLMGDDSRPRTVLGLGRGRDLLYKVTHQITQDTYTVNSEHILCLKSQNNFGYNSSISSYRKPDGIYEIPIKNYINLDSVTKRTLYGYYPDTVNFHVIKIPEIDPYILGFLFKREIGKDNTIRINNYLGCVTMDYLSLNLPTYNCALQYKNECYTVTGDYLIDFLKKCDGIIPQEYTKNRNPEIRRKLLSGLKDNVLYNKSKEVDFLGKSLGNTVPTTITVEPLYEGDYYGFTVDCNERFLLGNFIVTHNTKLCRALSDIIDLPFFQISFGGMTDANVLIGHDYTYTGSKCGRIASITQDAKCMNYILYCDEIDKLSESEKSKEVYGVLTHLLDDTQNHEFTDLYLDWVKLNLSKVLFVMSFNDPTNIDPVVLNRMKVIEIKKLSTFDKIYVAQKFILPEINFNNFVISDDAIKYIIEHKTNPEDGMRNLKRNIETIVGRLNTVKILSKCKDRTTITKNLSYQDIDLILDYNDVSTKVIDTLLGTKGGDESWRNMYC
jgi:hypothetical protein